ncbi:MAG: hypothetical protein HOO96_22885 [Polyangiaceae bacterium]|nr:hypothetical protein [Polyangiaceae bacterium]
MRATSHRGLPAILVVVAGCSKPSGGSSVATATPTQTAIATASAPAPLKTRPAPARACHVGTSVVASEGRGALTHGIATAGGFIVVTWGELRPAGSGFGGDGAKQRTELWRLFDASLGARGPASVIGQQEAVDAFSNGVAPYALGERLGVGTCAWAAFAGRLACKTANVDGSAGGDHYDDPGVAGPGPQGDRLAAAGVGDASILLVPQCQDVRIVSSAAKKGARPLAYGTEDARTACEPKRTIDVPALAALGEEEAAGAWRHGNLLEGRRMGKDGQPRGPIAAISVAGDVGAPAIVSAESEARVLYASRPSSTAPYALTLAHWKSAGPVARAVVSTGSAPAVAPSLVAVDDPACNLVSWTEGKGTGTRVRAGLVCNDALVVGSVTDVSTADVEAGDSELARVGTSGAFVVWQELPKGKPAELRLAKVTCE